MYTRYGMPMEFTTDNGMKYKEHLTVDGDLAIQINDFESMAYRLATQLTKDQINALLEKGHNTYPSEVA